MACLEFALEDSFWAKYPASEEASSRSESSADDLGRLNPNFSPGESR